MPILHHPSDVQVFNRDVAWFLPYNLIDHLIRIILSTIRKSLMKFLYLYDLFLDILPSSYSFRFFISFLQTFVFSRKSSLLSFKFLF